MTATAAGVVGFHAESSASYRWKQRWLRAAISYVGGTLAIPDWCKLCSVPDERRFVIEVLCSRLRLHARRDRLTQLPASIYASMIRLQCNRLLGLGSPARENSLGTVAANTPGSAAQRGSKWTGSPREDICCLTGPHVNGKVAESECA